MARRLTPVRFSPPHGGSKRISFCYRLLKRVEAGGQYSKDRISESSLLPHPSRCRKSEWLALSFPLGLEDARLVSAC